jgi:3-hydroxyisobutyrate dehydrogenase
MLTELGATKATSLDEIAAEADTIVSMVTACDHVRSVYAGPDGLLAKCQGRARLILDSSTINPSTSMEMISLAKESGHTFIDTPVGGGVPAAKAGTLTFMVGAHEDSEEWARAKVLLDHMGSNVVPCGAPGKGGAAKLCNNLILGISMLGVAEGYRLAEKLGVDMHLFDSVVNGSSGRCWSSDTYNPVPALADKYPNAPASRDYGPPSFMAELMLKDLGLALQAADGIDLKMPMLQEAERLYKGTCDKGHGRLCFSSVFKHS